MNHIHLSTTQTHTREYAYSQVSRIHSFAFRCTHAVIIKPTLGIEFHRRGSNNNHLLLFCHALHNPQCKNHSSTWMNLNETSRSSPTAATAARAPSFNYYYFDRCYSIHRKISIALQFCGNNLHSFDTQSKRFESKRIDTQRMLTAYL